MTDPHDGTRWPLLVVGGGALLAVGLVLGYQLRPGMPSTPVATSAPDSLVSSETSQSGHVMDSVAPPVASAPDAVVTLTPELIARAGIKTSLPETGMTTSTLRIPGVVAPNAYKEVAVTSLVSGRVVQVRAELGQRVIAGESLATIYSPDLADAQTAFIVARADQVAHAQRQVRTQRLAAIGAVSREEYELLEAERAMHDAAVEKARARLALLGIAEDRAQRLAGPQDVVTSIDIKAPLTGMITVRGANPGLNIDPATPLFTIVDLADVWVIADLFERDFAKVRVGSQASITSTSYPDLTLRGRISYIDPQVRPETRTAQLRIEVPNASGRLRFGMYVDAQIDGSGQPALLVPKAAVQLVGNQSVVYVASQGDSTRFAERRVDVAASSGDRVAVLAGLEPTERIVTDGVFFVRAEAERLRGGRR
jgi:cobalt-zinc-cadmium efflux system membrane fusion protein